MIPAVAVAIAKIVQYLATGDWDPEKSSAA